MLATSEQSIHNKQFALTARQSEAVDLISSPASNILFYGGARCVSGDTILDGHTRTIKELASLNKPVYVRTSHGLQAAEAPFLKGQDELLTITTESHSVTVTDDHRFWGGCGWIKAKDLSLGDPLSVTSLHESSLGSSLSELHEDGLHYRGIREDYQGDYSLYPHQCDPQLPQIIAFYLTYRALQFGVAQHNRIYPPFAPFGLDNHTHPLVQHAFEYNPVSKGLGLQSTKDDSPLSYFQSVFANPSFLKIYELFQEQLQRCPINGLPYFLPLSAELGIRNFYDLFYPFVVPANPSSPCDTPSKKGYKLEVVNKITTTSKQDYYTLHVPNCQHYFANGVLHHNSTKTFTFVRSILIRALAVPKSRHLIARFRFNHVKASIVFDTFPKVMELCFPDVRYKSNNVDYFVQFTNGSTIWFGGLDDKERTEKILGNEYATIFLNEVSQLSYGSYLTLVTRLAQQCFYEVDGELKELRLKMFCDENPPNRSHWSHKLFIDKIEPEEKLKLKDPENYTSFMMNPVDNRENLSPTYLKSLDNLPKRKRDRYYLGLFGDDTENALWTDKILNDNRVDNIPENVSIVRTVVAVDPSGASDNPEEHNDDIGIGVISLGSDGIAYVLEDLTLHVGPAEWGKVVASAYDRHEADRVVGEENFGGAMVRHVVETAKPLISYKSVRASKGKAIRAEPISALHENGKIKFVGRFDEMEDELTSFTTTGYTGSKSPNRADWFVWGIYELFPGLTKPKKKDRDQIYRNIPKVKRFGHTGR